MAILAAISLGVLDYFVITLFFLMEGDVKPAIMAAIVVTGFATGVLLRQPWLIFASQNCISLLILIRALQYGERLRLANVVIVVGVVVIGNLLAWLVARAVLGGRVAST